MMDSYLSELRSTPSLLKWKSHGWLLGISSLKNAKIATARTIGCLRITNIANTNGVGLHEFGSRRQRLPMQTELDACELELSCTAAIGGRY